MSTVTRTATFEPPRRYRALRDLVTVPHEGEPDVEVAEGEVIDVVGVSAGQGRRWLLHHDRAGRLRATPAEDLEGVA